MADQTVRRTGPLDHDEYRERRKAMDLAYTESIREYDRLVTWSSAGALGLSITFLEKFGNGADRASTWWLAAGWVSLGLALASSLWSQYFSSRIYSWRRNELDHLQLQPEDRSETWETKAVRLDRVASKYALATKLLTVASGVLLVGGMMFIARFAFLNAPFSAAGGAPERPPVVVPGEKKGQDYNPEPVPRPQPSPPQAPTPQEKR